MPAAKSIEKVMQPSTTAVPRSGWRTMSTAATLMNTSSGRTKACHWSRRLARRASRSAAKTTMASFISSEGWSWMEPIPIHRLEPPAK